MHVEGDLMVANASPLKAVPTRLRLTRIRSIPAEFGLVALVLASFGGRFAAAMKHSVPRVFPDEYIYAQLANGIAHGRLTIRGHPAHFPALLEPLLAAPLWLVGNIETSYRLTQAMHAVVASLLAVPVYLLARRLALPSWQCLACAACALLLPSLVYASFITADAVGVTFAVSAVYAGICAVERPTRRSQLVFLALAGLATFARIQYVILIGAFVVAAIVMSNGRPIVALERYRLSAGLLCVPILAVIALGPGRFLGYYDSVLHLHMSVDAARWAANDAMLLVYACGYVLVPAGLTGVVLALTRPLRASEKAFAAFFVALVLMLFVEASLYAANGADRFQERYLMALPPLIPIFFFVCVRRELGRSARLATLAFSLAFVVVAARVPLSGYAALTGSQDSPTLQAVLRIQKLTSTGTGSLIIALSVAMLSIPALLPILGDRRRASSTLVVAMATLFAVSIGATATDNHESRAQEQLLPADVRWVDHTGLENVSVLVTPSSFRPIVSEHLFWNRSLTRLLQMSGGVDVVDVFGYDRVRILRDGTILAGGRPVTSPLLVEEYADAVELSNARLVRIDTGASLWRPTGPARFVTLTYGRYLDGWLSARQATVTVWPHDHSARRGALCLDLSLPGTFRRNIQLRGPGYSKTVAVDARGEMVAVPVVAAREPWTLGITSASPLSDSGRLVSAQVQRPRFVEVPLGSSQDLSAACR